MSQRSRAGAAGSSEATTIDAESTSLGQFSLAPAAEAGPAGETLHGPQTAIAGWLAAGFDGTESMRAALARYEARLAGDRSDSWAVLAGVLAAQLAEALTELEHLAGHAIQAAGKPQPGQELDLEAG